MTEPALAIASHPLKSYALTATSKGVTTGRKKRDVTAVLKGVTTRRTVLELEETTRRPEDGGISEVGRNSVGYQGRTDVWR